MEPRLRARMSLINGATTPSLQACTLGRRPDHLDGCAGEWQSG